PFRRPMLTRMILAVVTILAALALAVLLANYFQGAGVSVDERPGSGVRPPGDECAVLTWNIGYAGLGRDADFIADGGRHLRSAGKTQIEANLASIRRVLARVDPDIVLIQEAAGPGFMTRGVDVVAGLRAQLRDYRSAFSPDVTTKLLPQGLSLRHGLATFTRIEASATAIAPLPEEPSRMGGILPRRYHLEITRTTLGGHPLSLFNVHLAAFDERAETRRRQVEAVFRDALEEYRSGSAVILGGDWNLLLADTHFPYTTEAKYLSWVHPFPREAIPSGWTIAADPLHPTIRTNERPYRPGENYTGVIDGFIVSPNVETIAVTGYDLGFEATDHQPVLGRFRWAGDRP
ncbi:MAG: endonuclease/exonuclease/phosphatase family protein, partial [Candidatus Eiseniibacteriota bacterium]